MRPLANFSLIFDLNLTSQKFLSSTTGKFAPSNNNLQEPPRATIDEEKMEPHSMHGYLSPFKRPSILNTAKQDPLGGFSIFSGGYATCSYTPTEHLSSTTLPPPSTLEPDTQQRISEPSKAYQSPPHAVPSLRTRRGDTPHPGLAIMDDTFDADTPVPSIESAESVTSDKMDSNHELGTIRNANEATPLTQLLAMNCDTIQESSLFTPAPSASVAPAASIAPSTSTASISSSRSDRSTKKARLKTLKKHHPSVKLIIDHTAHHYRASITRPDPPPLPEWLNLRETAQQLARLPQTNSKAYKLPLRRATREAASLMKAWRSSHPTWREAYRANGKMPWLPTRSELFAIEILEEKGRGMPRCITKLFEENEVELGWVFDHGYVEPGEPTGEGWEGVADFWKGAKVCDEAWRLAYMKDPKGKVSSLEFEDDLTALVREVVCRGSGRGVTEEASVVSEESQESGEGMVVKNEVGGAEDIEGEQREEELQERLHEEQLHVERPHEESLNEERLQLMRAQEERAREKKAQEERAREDEERTREEEEERAREEEEERAREEQEERAREEEEERAREEQEERAREEKAREERAREEEAREEAREERAQEEEEKAREEEERAREEKAREEKLQERRRQNTKRKREKRQEEKLQREKLQREKPQEEKRQEEMREKQGSQNEQNGETQNDHRNTSVTHQQTSPAPEQSLNTTISAPILKRIMIETVKEAMRDFGLDNLGKRQRQEDREDDDDDVPALTARKKQKITDHDNTAKQTDLPSPPPGSETPPAKVHESVEGYGNNKIEGKITEEMFIDLANKHNAGVERILELEKDKSAIQSELKKTANELKKTTNELKETTKELKETTNRCAVMEERQKATEKENKILRNQLTACFQRLELVEKGYYLQSPQPAQGSPARVQDQPTLQAQGRQSANVEQQQQQQNGGRSRGSSFYVGPTYSRPSI